MFRLSNDLELELIAESGTMGFGRDWWPERISNYLRWPMGPWRGRPLHDWSLFDAVVLKTITFPPHEGNIGSYSPRELLKVMRPITRGWLEGTTIRKNGFQKWFQDSYTIVGWMNAIGLRNPGLYGFLKEHYYYYIFEKRIVREQLNIFVSVAPKTEQEASVMAQELNSSEFAGLVYNSKDQTPDNIVKLTEILREGSYRLPVMIKLDPHHPIRDLAWALKDFAEAIFINAVRFRDRFPERKDPMSWCGGSRISGQAAHLKTWAAALEATKVNALPVVWPIWEYEDALIAEAQGAAAFSLASRFILFPWKANECARRLRKEKAKEAGR